MARYRPHDEVISRRLDRETVILDLKSGEYFGLNETGARIWQLLETHDTADIAQQLSREFDVSADEAAAAVDALVEQLLQRALIETWTDQPAP